MVTGDAWAWRRYGGNDSAVKAMAASNSVMAAAAQL